MILILGMELHIPAQEFILSVTTNANGCDSVSTLNLTIYPSSTSSYSCQQACDSFTWNGISHFIPAQEFTQML